MRHVIQTIVDRAHQGINFQYAHIVHDVTGPAIFTRAVKEALLGPADLLYGNDEEHDTMSEEEREEMKKVLRQKVDAVSAGQLLKESWNSTSEVGKRCQELGVCLMQDAFFGGMNVQNLYGSRAEDWKEDGYVSWLVEKDDVAKKVGGSNDSDKAVAEKKY